MNVIADTYFVHPREVMTSRASARVDWDHHLRQLFLRLEGSNPKDAPLEPEAARLAHCSQPTLRRRLAAAGLSWRAFVANWRLAEASRLRECSDAPLKVVAPAVGYASASTLSRALARHAHETVSRGTAEAQGA
jgi:AraC-like DNA-binding protein